MRRIMRRKMRTTFFISSRSAKIPLLTTDDRVDQRILDLRRMGRRGRAATPTFEASSPCLAPPRFHHRAPPPPRRAVTAPHTGPGQP